MGDPSLKPPDVFEYLDYRKYLKDFVEFARANRRYSVRRFAQQVGFKSSGFLNMVISGRRNLTGGSAKKVATGFHLNIRESDFFFSLIQFFEDFTY